MNDKKDNKNEGDNVAGAQLIVTVQYFVLFYIGWRIKTRNGDRRDRHTHLYKYNHGFIYTYI